MQPRRLCVRFALVGLAVVALGANGWGFPIGTALQPCAPDAEQPAGALCGKISVPENRAVTGGREIALNIVVLPSQSAAGHADPVFGLAGGPGGASTGLAVAYPRLYDALQAGHDIVLVDARGTGRSHPLTCVTTDLKTAPAHAFDDLPDAAALTACRDRLAKSADLTQYTTGAMVADLEAVRRSLGYTKINVLAVSHGTRVGLEYLRRYGPQVRAIALSGVVSPAYPWGLAGAKESQQTLLRVFELCAAQPECQKTFPNVAKEFDAVIAALDTAPVTALVPIPDGAPTLRVTISRRVFTRELFEAMQFRENLSALPAVIHQASAKDFMPFAMMVLQRQLSRGPVADGQALSVLCAQDVPSFTPAAVTAATQGTFLRSDRAQFLTRACAVWPHAAADAASREPVQSATPALLISGALDPIAPSSYAAAVARTLPNSLHVVVANVAHVPANVCVNNTIVAFMKSGVTAGLDTACAANFAPIKFLTSLQ